MKAIVFAYHDVGCEGLEALLRQGVQVPFVITHQDDPGENIWFRSVARLAASHGIPVHAPGDVNHPLWIERIRSAEPDFLFSFYYRKMLKPDVLEIASRACFNLHGSLLPKYRGRSPVNWVLVHGEKETGVSLHHMTPKPDDGDVVAQERVEISADDTALTLFQRMTKASGVLLDKALPGILEGTAPRTPQDAAQASYFGGRKPADGEILWQQSSTQVRNLVRAVTVPYPGAFSHAGDRKCLIWEVSDLQDQGGDEAPGTICSTDPLVVACGTGAVRVDFAQPADGLYMSGPQLAAELGLRTGMQLTRLDAEAGRATQRLKVLILGVNGFIGSALSERLLSSDRYHVHGMDLRSDYVEHLRDHDQFSFEEGDISIHREWLEYHVKKCDIILPLVAIATPIEYTRNPLRVFELDFEENLHVVRYCVKYDKRLIFPSTSEVYGMCDEDEFDEDNSRLILGPIRMQRWIYSCSKQLLDRVIWAYGDMEGLKFTLFRPFNWVGPKLDRLSSARVGSSRVITQMILNLVEGEPIQLMDGGAQRRCFTDVTEGVECLFRIIENKDDVCDGGIFNIGNPVNECSIRELAQVLVKRFEDHPLRDRFPPFAGFRDVESESYYGPGYQDVTHRRPSIRNARKHLDWQPHVSLEDSVERTLDFFLRQSLTPGGIAGT